LKEWLRGRANDLARRRGYEIVPAHILYDWQLDPIESTSQRGPLPTDAKDYLTESNPRLIGLKRRYESVDARVTAPSVWQDRYVTPAQISHFRGDSPWLWQGRGRNSNRLAYAITYYYLLSIDRLGLLSTLTEDDSFGNFLVTIAGHSVSRDLLDSVGEIEFIDRHLGSRRGNGHLRILDIGAGYGRLAHRVVSALPWVESYICTDAVAVSTFVCEYYLSYRAAQRASVIPLDRIKNALAANPVDLAINILSFSECKVEAIEWWVSLLSQNKVKNLMIVPNRVTGTGESLLTKDGSEFGEVLRRHGYRHIAKEPKYRDPIVQEFGLYPTWRHLFELV